MLNFLLGNCSCTSSIPDLSADLELFNLDIIEVLSPTLIRIFLDLKFSLNCTNVTKGDAVYLSKYQPELRREARFKDNELLKENLLFFEDDAESSYSGLLQNTFDLSPDIYCILYLRPLQKYDLNNTLWKALGVSKAFKLELLEDEGSVLRKSGISLNNTKSNNVSFIDFFNKSILGLNDSPPRHDLQISKLRQINLEEEPDFIKKKSNTQRPPIFDTNKETSPEESILNSYIQEDELYIKENKLIEVMDAQKFYAESLMKIKKSNHEFVISPKNHLIMLNKRDEMYKENIFME